MKVKELRAYLEKEDQESEVYVKCYGRKESFSIDEVTNGVDENNNPITVIFIDPIVVSNAE